MTKPPDIPTLLHEPDTTVAVVGATDDLSKYGGRIYRDLKAKGFTVFAVNPGRDTVDGDPAWPSVAALPEPPTIVDIVVPPAATIEVLKQCLDAGLMNVWVQPGAEDATVIEYLEANDFNALVNSCIMVAARSLA